MSEVLRWGLVGTGEIAADFVTALDSASGHEAVNVVGSQPAKGAAFAQRFRIARSAETLAELLADDEVNAVYVASPNHLHAEQTIASLNAGKDVLCEKPLSTSLDQTAAMFDAAKRNQRFLMEGYMYRCHPLVNKLLELIKSGAIGTPQHLRADFGFREQRIKEHRLFNPTLGGGAVLDVGGYPVSLARLIAGAVVGEPFSEPTMLTVSGHLGPTGVDELATAQMGFASGFTAQLACAVHHDIGMEAVIFGNDGRIVLPCPWFPGGERQGLAGRLWVYDTLGRPRHVECKATMPVYALEAEVFRHSRLKRSALWPALNEQESLNNQKVLDQWREGIEQPAPLSTYA